MTHIIILRIMFIHHLLIPTCVQCNYFQELTFRFVSFRQNNHKSRHRCLTLRITSSNCISKSFKISSEQTERILLILSKLKNSWLSFDRVMLVVLLLLRWSPCVVSSSSLSSSSLPRHLQYYFLLLPSSDDNNFTILTYVVALFVVFVVKLLDRFIFFFFCMLRLYFVLCQKVHHKRRTYSVLINLS